MNHKKLAIILLLMGLFVSCTPNPKPQLEEEPPSNAIREENQENLISNPNLTNALPREIPPEIPEQVPRVISQEAPSNTTKENIKTENQEKAVKEKIVEKKEVIGSYKTYINQNEKDRNKNIQLSIDKIKGYKIQSGQTFSFNNIVGERTEEKGYKIAPIIIKGKKYEDYGGGICQVTSTLYNAVLEAGLKVTERHAHTKEVEYVPKDKDAAVSYGTQDFKFINNTKNTIEIGAVIQGNELIVNILKIVK